MTVFFKSEHLQVTGRAATLDKRMGAPEIGRSNGAEALGQCRVESVRLARCSFLELTRCPVDENSYAWRQLPVGG